MIPKILKSDQTETSQTAPRTIFIGMTNENEELGKHKLKMILNFVPINSAFAAVDSFNTVVSNDFEMRFESISSVLKSVLTVGLSKLRCSRVIFCLKSKVYY